MKKQRNAPIRVLMITDHATGISGPHRNVVGTLNALGRLDEVRVTLFAGRIDPAEPYFLENRVQIKLGYNPHRLSISLGKDFREAVRLARDSDLIYVPNGLKSFVFASAIKMLVRRPLVAGPNVTHLPIRSLDAPGIPELAIMADRWIEASDARARHVLKCIPRRYAEKIRCIRHAIDHVKFSPEHRRAGFWSQYGLSERTVKILFVGRDTERLKGVKELLDCLELLNQTFSDELSCILVGKMSQETLERVASQPNIRCLGFKSGDELPQIYANCDISVVPSSWENMPFCVLEAMSSGLAVVASRTGGIPELVEHERSGLLVDAISEEGLHLPEAGRLFANSVSLLVRDPSLRGTLQKNARQRATSHFSEARLGADLLNLFREATHQTLNEETHV